MNCPLRRQPSQKEALGDNKGGTKYIPSAGVDVQAAKTEPPSKVPKFEEQVLEDEDEERICRYCFEGDESGELISPCICSGGQKFVHLSCLRMWQRAVLVSQPTHPDLYGVDSRQRVCNVCRSEFKCAPPTRTELMASITGPEIAALIEEGCLVGSAESFSSELEAQIAGFPEAMREGIVCRNWIKGVFLIVKVVEGRERDTVLLRVSDDEELELLLNQIGGDGQTLHLRGRKFTVLPAGPLVEFADDPDTSPAKRRAAMRDIELPVTLHLRPEPTADCGEDGVVAVNLTWQIDLTSSTRSPLRLHRSSLYAEAAEEALGGSAPLFQVQHFVGGPCEEDQPAACLVLTHGHYVVIQSSECLEESVRLAQHVARGDASLEDDPRALPLSTLETSTPDGVPVDRENVGTDVKLYVCWGYAGWSRCQLMGEIARGSWGLCRSVPEDVLLRQGPEELWRSVYPRLILAPKNEMSESYDGQSSADEERRRQLRRMAIFHEILHGHMGEEHGELPVASDDGGPEEEDADVQQQETADLLGGSENAHEEQ